MDTPQKPRSFGTHDGTFHADEVTACSLLLLFDLIDRDKIFRTRDSFLLERCEYVCDVGGIYDSSIKRFDHHQTDYTGPLSSAGMVLGYLVQIGLISPNEGGHLNNALIHGVDAHDTGYDPNLPGFCLFSHVISNFTPISYDASAVEQDMAFLLAVDFTTDHLRRLLGRYRYHLSCKDQVKAVMQESKEALVFSDQIPWMDAFFELGGEDHSASFVIMPVKDHWKLRGIPPTSEERMKVRIAHPSTWAGKMDKALEEASGIEGGIFCHKGRFISMWQTKEAALTALEKVLDDHI